MNYKIPPWCCPENDGSVRSSAVVTRVFTLSVEWAGNMRTAAHPRRTILVATDFSKPAKLVIPYALKLALVLNLRLIILHVVKAPPASSSGLRARAVPFTL